MWKRLVKIKKISTLQNFTKFHRKMAWWTVKHPKILRHDKTRDRRRPCEMPSSLGCFAGLTHADIISRVIVAIYDTRTLKLISNMEKYHTFFKELKTYTETTEYYEIQIPDVSKPSIFMLQYSLQWRHNGYDSVSKHQPYDCLLNRLFRRRSKKTSKLRVTGLCAGNSPRTGEFTVQMASDAENVSIWWRHHVFGWCSWYQDDKIKY